MSVMQAKPESMGAMLEMIRRGVIEVRADGTVWKLRNLNRTPLAAPRRLETKSTNGYLLVKVCLDGKQYAVTAHRLAWTVLRGPIPDGLEPNHKNGNKHDNCPDNLELATRAQNIKHAWDTGLRDRSNVAGHIAGDADRLHDEGMTFEQIGVALNVSTTTAFRAVQASRKVA